MFKVTKYPHGTFSWTDCQSTDASKGKRFYADLMGWEIDDQPMGDSMVYTMFMQDGVSVAALNQMQPEMESQGVPSHWNNYVTVDDVDAMVSKVKELGGTVISGPFDVFDSGRMMVIQDPEGASVSLWQAKNHIGAGLVNTPGAMGWNELSTRDPKIAKAFYGGLLGWQIDKDPSQDNYYIIMNKGRPNGGLLLINEEWGDMPPNWMVYFSVSNIDQSVEKVKSLGGKIHVPIVDTGDVGRFSVVGDPQGAVSTLIQLKEPQPWTS
jgi:hypothetical protein